MGWADLARAQSGVISRRQLRAAGQSDQMVDALLSQGALERRAPAVFIVRGAPLSYAARLWIAVCDTGGTLGFATAAHLWGLVPDAPARIQVVIPRAAHVRAQNGIRLHRIDLLPAALDHRHGLPVTTRLATLLDHLGRLPFADACRLADRARQRGWLAPGDFERRVRREPGRTGNVTLRRLADVTSDGAAAESERRLHALLRQAGLREWVANYDLWHEGTLLGIIDVAFVELRIAVEVDGWAYHSDVDRFRLDRARQNRLIAAGWSVLRFAWADLIEEPGRVIAEVQHEVARRTRDSGLFTPL